MLTGNYDAMRKDGILITYEVAPDTEVYKGALVCHSGSGGLVPGGDPLAVRFAGTSYEAGKPGAPERGCRVWKVGTYVYDAQEIDGPCDMGVEVYIVDDHTVTKEPTGNIPCGTICEFEDDGRVRVRIDLHVDLNG